MRFPHPSLLKLARDYQRQYGETDAEGQSITGEGLPQLVAESLQSFITVVIVVEDFFYKLGYHPHCCCSFRIWFRFRLPCR